MIDIETLKHEIIERLKPPNPEKSFFLAAAPAKLQDCLVIDV